MMITKAFRLFTVFCLFMFLMSGVCLKANAGIFEDDYARGKTYFDSRMFDPAYEIFSDLFEIHPEDENVNFMLGRSAFETGDYERAVMIFDRLLIMRPDSDRYRLELARSFLELGSSELAIFYFEQVLESDLPENVRNNVEMMVEKTRNSIKKHFFSGMLKLFGGIDDNPGQRSNERTILIPLYNNLPVEQEKKETDYMYGNLFQLQYRYRPSSDFFVWNSSLINYNLFYDTYDYQNMNYYHFKTGPFLTLNSKTAVKFDVGVSHGDRDYDYYYDTVLADAGILFMINKYLTLNSEFLYEYRMYDEKNRDSGYFSLSVVPTLRYGRADYFLGFSVDSEDSENSQYDIIRYNVNPGINVRFFYDINVMMSGSFSRYEYDAVYPMFEKNRSDDVYTFNAGVSKVLWISKKKKQKFSMTLDYKHQNSSSNIDLYDYTKNQGILSVVYEF